MKYSVENPDYELSPYTGMTREHWLEVCSFLLEGIFSNVDSMEAPAVSPRTEFEISYPNKNTAPWKEYAARFEGLARSFLIAAPLLFNRPDAKAGGYSVKEYYKKHILYTVTEKSPSYMLSLREVQQLAGEGEHAFQHTCECASLVIGLDQCRTVIWDTYTKEEKDKIAAYLMEFGTSRTVAHNWRLFNMLILGFLYKEGYEVDEGMIRDHGQVILSYYAGGGWYRDGHRFDYYSPWAFQVYGPIWNTWYGYEKEPYIAAKIEEYSNCLMESYDGMFDEDAHVTLWGRSGIYRNAASAPYSANFLLKNPKAEPGLARRINSGALLQFITKEEVFENGVPALGFYGRFLPMIQGYSCAESPFWIANPFLCLCFPENHPFWTKKEENGNWDKMGSCQNTSYVLDGPGIVTDQHGGNGAVEFRTAKALFEPGDEYIRYYVRLSFHSQFPWEDFDYEGAEAMQYSLLDESGKKAQVPNIMMYSGVRDGVLYRTEYFDFRGNFQGGASVALADFPVANGMIRVDKIRIPEPPFTLTMGAYGFPADGRTEVKEQKEGKAFAKILKGSGRQLAFVVYSGFEEIQVKRRKGVNPASDESLLMYGICRRQHHYEYRPYVMVSAVLSKEGDQDFTCEELFPIRRLTFEDEQKCGGYGSVKLEMKDGRDMVVDYSGMEGRLMI